jgi:hypothetical protein
MMEVEDTLGYGTTSPIQELLYGLLIARIHLAIPMGVFAIEKDGNAVVLDGNNNSYWSTSSSQRASKLEFELGRP